MDITRHWRLKSSKVDIYAAKVRTGEVILPNQTSIAAKEAKQPKSFDLHEENPHQTNQEIASETRINGSAPVEHIEIEGYPHPERR